jgi:hypothetical protein
MAFPAQTISGEIVQIVDKALCATGQLVEVFTDQDGQKYTRDLAGAHAPHILIPLEEKIEEAEAVVEKIDEETGSIGDSFLDKVEGALETAKDVVEAVVEDLTGSGSQEPSTEDSAGQTGTDQAPATENTAEVAETTTGAAE